MPGIYYFWNKEHLSKSEISDLHDSVIKDGIHDILFYDSGIKCKSDWLEFVSDQWFVMVTDNIKTPVGFFWLNGFQGKTAQIHFTSWRSWKDKISMGIAAIKWINDNTELQSLYGCTPKHYTNVIKFIIDVGFENRGELPGACYIEKNDKYVPGVISVFDFNSIKGD